MTLPLFLSLCSAELERVSFEVGGAQEIVVLFQHLARGTEKIFFKKSKYRHSATFMVPSRDGDSPIWNNQGNWGYHARACAHMHIGFHIRCPYSCPVLTTVANTQYPIL
jgi:hypothetical protein